MQDASGSLEYRWVTYCSIFRPWSKCLTTWKPSETANKWWDKLKGKVKNCIPNGINVRFVRRKSLNTLRYTHIPHQRHIITTLQNNIENQGYYMQLNNHHDYYYNTKLALLHRRRYRPARKWTKSQLIWHKNQVSAALVLQAWEIPSSTPFSSLRHQDIEINFYKLIFALDFCVCLHKQISKTGKK